MTSKFLDFDLPSNGDGSEGSPWNTLSGISVSSGDDLSMAGKGRETLAIDDGITYKQWVGKNPGILDGSDIMTTWTNYSGNVWQKTGVTTEPKILFVNDTKGTLEVDLSSLSADREWFWDSGTDILYLYWTAGDPDTTGDVVEAGQRAYSIYADAKTGFVVSGITAQRPYSRSIYVSGDTSGVFRDCVARDPAYQSLRVNAMGGGVLEFIDCTFSDGPEFSWYVSSHTGGTIILDGCDVSAATSYNVYLSTVTGGSFIIKNNKVHDGGNNGIRLNAANGSLADIRVEHNVVCSMADIAILLNSSNEIKLYRNSCYVNSSNCYITGTSTGAEVKGNVFYRTASFTVYQLVSGAEVGLLSDYNCFYNTGGNLINYDGVDYATLADYQSASNQDLNSISADPQLIDTTNKVFAPKYSSPCRNAGTWVPGSPATDIEGNPITPGSNVDIGAWEISWTRQDVWYVDSENGSDYNSGLTQSGAFKTVGKVEALQTAGTINAGDGVVWVDDSKWREQLDVASGISYRRSGTGTEKPIFDGSDIITGWAGPDGSGEYTVDLATEPLIVFKDNTKLDEGTISTLAAEEWGYDASEGTLYLGSNPAGHVVEAAQREYGVNIATKTGFVVSGVTTQKTNYIGTRVNGDCTGLVSAGVSRQNRYYDFVSGGMGSGVFEFKNCRGVGDTTRSVNVEIQSGGTIIVNGCDVSASASYNMYLNTITGGTLTVRNCKVHDGDADGIRLNGANGGLAAIRIEHNAVYGNNTDGSGITLAGSAGIVLSRNSCYGTRAQGYLSATSTGVEVNGNVFYRAAADKSYRILAGAEVGLQSDYNCFHSTGGNLIEYDGSDYATLPDYQHASNQDLNSINQDPLFVDAANKDFRLKSTSPCINAGTTISGAPSKDIDGTPVPRGGGTPDIGAHEHLGKVWNFWVH